MNEHEGFEKWLKGQESGASSSDIWRAAQKATIAAIKDALAHIAARQTHPLASLAVNDCRAAVEKIGKGE